MMMGLLMHVPDSAHPDDVAELELIISTTYRNRTVELSLCKMALLFFFYPNILRYGISGDFFG